MGRSVTTEKFKPKDEIQWMKKSCFLLEVWRLVPKRNVTGATLFRERCIPRDLRRSSCLAVTAQRNLSMLLVSIFATIILQASQKSPALKPKSTVEPVFQRSDSVRVFGRGKQTTHHSQTQRWKLNSTVTAGTAKDQHWCLIRFEHVHSISFSTIFGMIGWSPATRIFWGWTPLVSCDIPRSHSTCPPAMGASGQWWCLTWRNHLSPSAQSRLALLGPALEETRAEKHFKETHKMQIVNYIIYVCIIHDIICKDDYGYQTSHTCNCINHKESCITTDIIIIHSILLFF